MQHHGSSVYDEEDFFEKYSQKRSKGNAPNELLEYPIVSQLVGEIVKKDVLELGCGEGEYARELLENGARSYHGMDGSSNMLESARQQLSAHQVTLDRCDIEGFPFPKNSYDLVVSRLVFHYLAQLPPVLTKVYDSLRPGGTFVLSVEHPIITSCYESYHSGNKRGSWLVDDYFVAGPRINTWLNKDVVKYHRTIEEYLQLFQEAGFELAALRESKPDKQLFADPAEHQRRSRCPLFLIMEWRK